MDRMTTIRKLASIRELANRVTTCGAENLNCLLAIIQISDGLIEEIRKEGENGGQDDRQPAAGDQR